LLPSDTEIPTGAKKKQRSSSFKVGRPRKRPKPAQAPQQHDEAAAAASLLSMVTFTTASRVGQSRLKNDQDDNSSDEDDGNDDDDDDSSEDDGPPVVTMDPEHSLDVYHTLVGVSSNSTVTRKDATLPSTVHWDPTNPDGRKIGWKIKIEHPRTKSGNGGGVWLDGRVVRYDPHTHKHKIEFVEPQQHDGDSDDDNVGQTHSTGSRPRSVKKAVKRHCWIWLRNEQHNLQLATRMVWAHVKGYAWWPALVMESNSESAKTKDGYVLIEFFVTGEISCLRDTPESVRPFDPDHLDPVVAKHRKKRNQRAYQMALEEYAAIQTTRNHAAIYYAKAARDMACYYAPKNANVTSQTATSGPGLIGQRVQLFRPDLDYPYGDTVVGTIRQYSPAQKKWLVSMEFSSQQNQKTKYPPAWINVYNKEHALKVLVDKTAEATSTTPKVEELLPFLFGFEPMSASVANHAPKDDIDAEYTELVDLLQTRCRACVEYLSMTAFSPSKTTGTAGSVTATEPVVTCTVCRGSFHWQCVDPPWSADQWQRWLKQGSGVAGGPNDNDRAVFTCARCTPCRGCYQKDICFGSHAHPNPPPSVSWPDKPDALSSSSSLDLCFMCKMHYDADRFCPNCAHVWDDKKFGLVRRQIEYGSSNGGAAAAGRKRKSGAACNVPEDSAARLVFGRFEGDDDWPLAVPVDPTWFYPETTEWGYTEESMLACDSCRLWANAGCAMTEKEYDMTSDGKHAIYSKEFLCRACCRRRCADLIQALQQEDRKGLFAHPVSEKDVPNYLDLIKEPMDLQSMQHQVETQEYGNYGFIRELFEQMIFNALTYNSHVRIRDRETL
jgi:PWWP domain/Bromodomain